MQKVITQNQKSLDWMKYFEALRSKGMFSQLEADAATLFENGDLAGWSSPMIARLWNLLGVTRYEINDHTGAFKALMKAYSSNTEDNEVKKNIIQLCGSVEKVLDLSPLRFTVQNVSNLLVDCVKNEGVVPQELINVLWKVIDDASEVSFLIDVLCPLQEIAHLDQVCVFLGEAFRRSGKLDDAIEILSTNRSYAAQNNLGMCFVASGKFERAVEAFQQSIKANKNFAPAYRQIARVLDDNTELNSLLSRINDISNLNSMQGHISHVFFAKYEAYNKLGRYGEAFDALLEANRLRALEIEYRRDFEDKLFADITAQHEYSDRVQTCSLDFKPVFVIGMPRSGTTLLERTLLKSLNIYSIGESNFFNDMMLEYNNFPSLFENKKWQERYKSLVKRYAVSDGFYIDKMPHNFRNVGLIRAALEDARFILVKRDLLPLKWSLWSAFFSSPGLGFSSTMQDINHHIALFNRYVEFFQLLRSDDSIVINYEDMISDMPAVVNKVQKFLGCGYLESNLSAGRDRPVFTASDVLSRKDIISSRNKEYQKFTDFMDDDMRLAFADQV